MKWGRGQKSVIEKNVVLLWHGRQLIRQARLYYSSNIIANTLSFLFISFIFFLLSLSDNYSTFHPLCTASHPTSIADIIKRGLVVISLFWWRALPSSSRYLCSQFITKTANQFHHFIFSTTPPQCINCRLSFTSFPFLLSSLAPFCAFLISM